MVDFLMVSERLTKKDGLETYEIRPRFKMVNPSNDLMIKGGDFYAIWDERKKMWSTREQDAIEIIDGELDKYVRENRERFEPRPVRILYMWDAESGMIDRWHNYCKKQMRDSFHMLDEKLIFSNTETKREDFASKRLSYPLAPGKTEAWDKLIEQLYGEKEKHKIEWCLGSIVNGASKKLQKFMVIYGEPGSGKSTLLDIIDKKLFVGYTESVDSTALGSASNQFAMESFRDNPLIAIQHEGKLSKIEDNTRLNSLVSHDKMPVNIKHQNIYTNAFKCFLILSSNEPVKITDAKSGLLRRLIDVYPTGNLFPTAEYKRLVKQIDFELGAIAWKCKEVYEADPDFYNGYMPINMLGATNDFYNFVMDHWPIFRKQEVTTLNGAYGLYTNWCEQTRVPYPYSQRAFKEELKNYFHEFKERGTVDGTRVRNIYIGFKEDKFDEEDDEKPVEKEAGIPEWLHMIDHDTCLLDTLLADQPAQYPTEDGRLERKWINCRTHLKDIDTHRLHHVKVPEKLIVIDFDISVNGEKNLERNLEEAAKWPATYAELSKSGKAIHLHYFYKGDVNELSSVYDDQIEVKTLLGDASLRRCLTKCNDIPIAEISTGLPKKEVKKTVDVQQIKSEKGLRTLIKRNLAKEIHPGTKPSMDFIEKILDDAYKSGLQYDISDMRNAITAFAAGSTHQAQYCLGVVNRLKYKSEEKDPVIDVQETGLGQGAISVDDKPILFYDIEVFPNLILINWKAIEDYGPRDFEGTPEERWKQYIERLKVDHKPVVRMINPKPADVELLLTDGVSKNKLVGFNCRRYDNHIVWGRMMGYSNAQLYMLSHRIISGDRSAFFGEAYNLSYTDVYDFASAGNKMSLKKLEIKMGFFHQELGLEWDKPVPEELWDKVAAYCDNDVLATEAAFRYLEPDWTARQILADVAGMTVNDTTNSLTTRIIFDNVRKPQSEFQYRKLSEPVKELTDEVRKFLMDACPDMMNQLHGEEDSLLPYFPGYCKENGVSTYKGEEVGEGGYVYAEPHLWLAVALLDIASMHPHSVIAECLFGPRFTKRFKEIVDGRVDIKHEAWDEVNTILDGKMAPYIAKVKSGEMTSKDLANALKTAINSVYGLTSAAFENAFRDPRNVDNIVAKRGALFMVDLKEKVQEKGFTVAHIKTDSIKIPGATPEIIQFVMDFGKKYGYSFEHEATYEKMCLVNDAVYIAKYATVEECENLYGKGYVPGDNRKHGGEWTATGKQFAVPYVYKTLFTKEPILFEDLCETFQVTGSLYLDFNEALPNVKEKEEELKKFLKDSGLEWADYMDILGRSSGDNRDNWIDSKLESVLRRLHDEIQRGHNYRFVGRVGLFTPVKPGCGGGLLMRESGGKFASATGAKDYRWCESDSIDSVRAITGQGKPSFTMDDIDKTYYNKLVDDARAAIAKYCDIEWFVT